MGSDNKPGTIWTRALFLIVVGVLSGVLVNALRPTGSIAWVQDWGRYVEARALKEGIPLISAEEARRQADTGAAMLLDARPDAEYDAGYLPGALSLPYQRVDEVFPDVQLFLFPDQPLVTYCSGPSCDEALLLALFLREQGYTNVSLFAGGYEGWLAAGYAVEGGL